MGPFILPQLKFLRYITAPLPIAPLANFRVLFGAVMFISVIRFIGKGWVHQLYVEPEFYFSYYGFEWVAPFSAGGMYLVFGLMALSALGICFGAFYRVSSALFFLSFTYVELLDKTNYLNHYYFVSVMAGLMMLLPAHRYLSVDVLLWPRIRRETVPRWTVGIIRMQLGCVYFFAGVAKLQYDWLVRAMPLAIWLPAKTNLPLIGGLMGLKWVAYAFSWFGALYDLTVPFFLLWKKTRWLAYTAVIAFHLMTWWLFPIGMFPFIMILSTLIYFPAATHVKISHWLLRFAPKAREIANRPRHWNFPVRQKILLGVLAVHVLIQAFLPFRYVLYPGDLFWTEQGFRFSWRVMLMEKAGTAFFYVRDAATGRELEVDNSDFLTPNQEKMMATQPDMILQYAHFLAETYAGKGLTTPKVRAEVYVTLNGSGSRLFIDPQVNLAALESGYAHKDWILPFEQ